MRLVEIMLLEKSLLRKNTFSAVSQFSSCIYHSNAYDYFAKVK